MSRGALRAGHTTTLTQEHRSPHHNAHITRVHLKLAALTVDAASPFMIGSRVLQCTAIRCGQRQNR